MRYASRRMVDEHAEEGEPSQGVDEFKRAPAPAAPPSSGAEPSEKTRDAAMRSHRSISRVAAAITISLIAPSSQPETSEL